MDYLVYDWGILFGIWLALILSGGVIFYFLYNKTNGEDKHLST